MSTSDWNLRAMTADDIPAALELWRATEGMGLGDSDAPERLAKFLERNPGLSAVARAAGGVLLGAVLCGDDGRRGALYHLAVTRNARGRGIARQLVDHAMRGLARRGIEKCNLLVFGDNTAGLSFWRKLGWTGRTDLVLNQKAVELAPAGPGGCGGRTC